MYILKGLLVYLLIFTGIIVRRYFFTSELFILVILPILSSFLGLVINGVISLPFLNL